VQESGSEFTISRVTVPSPIRVRMCMYCEKCLSIVAVQRQPILTHSHSASPAEQPRDVHRAQQIAPPTRVGSRLSSSLHGRTRLQ
jgi:hypothetical protein